MISRLAARDTDHLRLSARSATVATRSAPPSRLSPTADHRIGGSATVAVLANGLPFMEAAKADMLAFATFLWSHWQKIWSTNPFERINKEIKRRSRVVGIFPNEASGIRLVGAILADFRDEWQATDRRYLSEDSMNQLYPQRDTLVTAELTVGD